MTTLAKVVVTDLLRSRPKRKPNYESELNLIRKVGTSLLHQPEKMIQRLVHATRILCKADSAGLSLLEIEQTTPVFRWIALAGKYQKYKGATTPRFKSPCGVCLEREEAILYRHPHKHFSSLRDLKPVPEEALVLPVTGSEGILGTIWIVSNDPQRHFDSEDLRLMESVSTFLAIALEVKSTEQELREEGEFSRTVIESSPDCLKILDSDGKLTYMNQNGCSLLGIEDLAPYLGAEWLSFWEEEKDRHSAEKALKAVRKGKISHFQGFRPTVQGVPKWWDVTITPLKGRNGELLVVSRDITSLKKNSEALQELNRTLEEKVAQRTTELTTSNNRLLLLSKTLRSVELEEKKYLAKELHDEFGQHLTALRLTLDNLQPDLPDHCTPYLERAHQIHKTLAIQIRKLSFDLRDSCEEGRSLAMLLQQHFDKLFQEYKFKVRWKTNEEEVVPPSQTTIAVLRIVHEALNNIIRHAGVNSAQVTTSFNLEYVSVKIVDKGSGFPLKFYNRRRCSGISGMKERAYLLGGFCQVESTPGKGTIVNARIPCTREGA